MVRAIIALSVRNRGVVFLFTAALAVASAWAMKTIPLDATPDLSDTQVIVFTEWMGRSPDLVEDQVTRPLSAALLSAPRVTDVRGFSMFGMGFVYVLFEDGTDLYWARSRVLEFLQSSTVRLPAGVRPSLGPDATGIGWVLQYALVDKGGTQDLASLRALQDHTLRYALLSVPGVAEVASLGGQVRQYQVVVDPRRLSALGLSVQEVANAVRASTGEVGGRLLEAAGREYFIRGRGYVKSLEDLRAAVLRVQPGGVPLTVGDVATVQMGPDIRRGVTDLDGRGEVVSAVVVARHGENALAVIERVKERLETLKGALPPGVEVVLAYDRSALIHRAMDTLRHALTEEMVVVALVILLFLLHLGSSIIPMVVLPLGVAASFLPMKLLGHTSNIMSLGGIAIALGAMVDAAIVLVENAHKKLEHAPPNARRQDVLLEAAQEVGPSIFFSLVIMTVAFLPVLALEGQAGRLFIPLAITKTSAMATGALLSITLVPALMGQLIRGHIRPESEHPVSRALIRVYQPFVYVALRNPKSTMAMGVLAVLSVLPLLPGLGSEFMPPLDEGDLLYMPSTLPGISAEEARSQLQQQDRVLAAFPEVESVLGKVGRAETPTDPAPLSMAETVVRLKPRTAWRTRKVDRFWTAWAPGPLVPVLQRVWPDERPLTLDELTTEMSAHLRMPGWTEAWTMPIKARVDMLSTGIRTPVGIKVFGPDLRSVEDVGVRLEGVLKGVPGTRSVYYERSRGGLYVDIEPDRAALARHGLSVADLQAVVEGAVGGEPVAETVEGRARYGISVRLVPDARQDVEALKGILIPIPAPGAAGGGGGGAGGMGRTGMRVPTQAPRVLLAQAMGGMGGGSEGGAPAGNGAPSRTDLVPRTDTGVLLLPGMGGTAGMAGAPRMPQSGLAGMGRTGGADNGTPAAGTRAYVTLGQVARVKVSEGPPMVRSEAGMLTGYVYVDVDTGQRDVGGYVKDGRAAVERAVAAGELTLPPGTWLQWTGQYLLLERMEARMLYILPLTLLLVVFLLWLNFRSLTEALLVLLSVPFSLVGSFWALHLLDYRMSTAVWVGIIALVGLATETGVVMVVYLDAAFERRRAAGLMRNLDDIIWAHMEGTVQRVRPKLMTVATMLFGLVPLLWSEGTGADVMKRIAAPMVGGLITSAFLTLEIIPVVYTYWRLWELKAAARAAASGAGPGGAAHPGR